MQKYSTITTSFSLHFLRLFFSSFFLLGTSTLNLLFYFVLGSGYMKCNITANTYKHTSCISMERSCHECWQDVFLNLSPNGLRPSFHVSPCVRCALLLFEYFYCFLTTPILFHHCVVYVMFVVYDLTPLSFSLTLLLYLALSS